MALRAVIQHVRGVRMDTFGKLIEQFPDAIVIECDGHPMRTFARACGAAEDGAVFLEDDAILTGGFARKAMPYCDEMFTQFFSRRRSKNGANVRPGSTWICNVCFWIPPGHGNSLACAAVEWKDVRRNPTAFDLVVRSYLVSAKLKYREVIPSLANHAVGQSLLGKRPRDRSSPTWEP